MLRETGNVRESAEAAGVTRQAVYAARLTSPDFRAAWDDALEDAVDLLESKAWGRAKETSDTLLIFLLKAHRPAMYRETIRQEHTGKDGDAMAVKFVDYRNGIDTPSSEG